MNGALTTRTRQSMGSQAIGEIGVERHNGLFHCLFNYLPAH
jgi:hypothetical protein